ncbi:MAG: cell division protein SepF [Clostridiales bacterium]|nr:cell division protein SepF [Clostridiales bacterium]
MAGSFLNKLLTFIGAEAKEERDGYGMDSLPESSQDAQPYSTNRNSTTRDGERDREHTRRSTSSSLGNRRSYEESRANAPQMGASTASADAVRMVVFQPQTYEDTQTIIDNLKSRKPVIVNLESLNTDVAQRVLDFISGAIYALDGSVRKVSKGIFLLAPKGVDISGNFTSALPGSVKGKNYFNLPRRSE